MLFQKLGEVFKDFGGFSQTEKPKKNNCMIINDPVYRKSR